MVSSCVKKVAGVSALLGLLVAGFYCSSYETGPIYEFNAARDTKPVLEIFDKNWYWLLASPNSSPAFMLKYRTPNENPLYLGKLKIKVLRIDNKLAGFTAYYMEKLTEGRILFVAVDHDFRGKGYGRQLAEYAMNSLFELGAHKITLWTRLENLPAQRIYKSLGFVEAFRTDRGFIFFEYIP